MRRRRYRDDDDDGRTTQGFAKKRLPWEEELFDAVFSDPVVIRCVADHKARNPRFPDGVTMFQMALLDAPDLDRGTGCACAQIIEFCRAQQRPGPGPTVADYEAELLERIVKIKARPLPPAPPARLVPPPPREDAAESEGEIEEEAEGGNQEMTSSSSSSDESEGE
jgi:hypothetical protein